MLRKGALSLLMLVSIVAILPLAESAAHGIRQAVGMQRRHYRHHSRRWWRRHRRMRHQAAHRNVSLISQPTATTPMTLTAPPAEVSQTPSGWNTIASNARGETRFRAQVNAADQAALSVVALSRPAPAFLTLKEQKQIMGGVSFSELRRTVIDKMINAGGWVTNDYVSEVGDRRVFVVTAQTPADGRNPERAWNFYFTEVNGRIYSLSTEASLQSAPRMATEAERFIGSLK